MGFLVSGIIICSIIIVGSGVFWKRLRFFFFDGRSTYLDMIFVCAYFIEQAVFVTTFYFHENYARLLVSLFALIVLTTVSLQKLMMESKNRRLQAQTIHEQHKIELITQRYGAELDNLRNQIEKLESDKKELIKCIKL